MLANRHDWLAPFASELGVALTVESAMGITPPERATWIRMLMAEITRINADLAFLTGSVDIQTAQRARALREDMAVWFDQVTGNRVHPMFARIGGVAHDLPEGTLQRAADIAQAAQQLVNPARDAITAADLAGLAVLSESDALGFGASGPVGHASRSY